MAREYNFDLTTDDLAGIRQVTNMKIDRFFILGVEKLNGLRKHS